MRRKLEARGHVQGQGGEYEGDEDEGEGDEGDGEYPEFGPGIKQEAMDMEPVKIEVEIKIERGEGEPYVVYRTSSTTMKDASTQVASITTTTLV